MNGLEKLLLVTYIGITLGTIMTFIGIMMVLLGGEFIKPELFWFLKAIPDPTLSEYFTMTNGDVINSGFIITFMGLWQTNNAVDDKNKVLVLMDELKSEETSTSPA